MNYYKTISRTSFLVTITFALIVSCKQQLDISKEINCKNEINAFIKDHWKFSNSDSIIVDNETIEKVGLGNHYMNDCIRKLNKTEVFKLFGKPHLIDTLEGGTRFFYFTTLACYPYDKTP